MFGASKVTKAIKKLDKGQAVEISDSQIVSHIIDLGAAENLLDEEGYGLLSDIYQAYNERTEKLFFERYEDLIGRMAEIAFSFNDIADIGDIRSEKADDVMSDIEYELDMYRQWEKKIYGTLVSATNRLASTINNDSTEKQETYKDAYMYAMSVNFYGMVIAIIANRYRDPDPTGYEYFRDSLTMEILKEGLLWGSFHHYERKIDKIIAENYPDFSDGELNAKLEGMMKEYSIVMSSKVPTITKLMKIGEAYLYNCGVKKVNDELLDIIEDLIVFLKFYPENELGIVDYDFKKIFGQYSHPYTQKPISSAQDYLDAVSSQAAGTSIVTEEILSLEEVDAEYAAKYGNSANPATGKPIRSAADFVAAYKSQKR